jgi:ankyrin repeat protein
MSTNQRDAAGYTPLERAVLYGYTDLVAIFLDHGMDAASDDEVSELSKSANSDMLVQ